MASNATPQNAAHLLRRAAWGGTPAEIQHVVDVGIDAAVDELLDPSNSPVVGEPQRRPGVDAYELGALQSWFARLAATSPTPAIEKLTWFWTGHFATSNDKVELPDLLHRQWVTCRRLGLGRFDNLLKAITRDPAMNVWLDLELSVVGNPNENFARELLELFSMGASNGYTQGDVVNAARAFTGYGLAYRYDRPTGVLLLQSAHDHGEKAFLGERGNLDGDGVVDLVVQRPECHEFIAGRIWHRYAGTAPTNAVLAELARSFAQRGRTDDLLRTMLTMDEFYADEVKDGLVSQPFEVLVRAVRGFDLDLYDAESTPYDEDGEDEETGTGPLPRPTVAFLCEQLGQEPGRPPNVAGWPHNIAWLDSNRAAGRLLAGIELGALVAVQDTPTGHQLRSLAGSPEELVRELLDRFGVVEVSAQTIDAVRAAITTSDPTETVAAAFAVAFTSPEVTLS